MEIGWSLLLPTIWLRGAVMNRRFMLRSSLSRSWPRRLWAFLLVGGIVAAAVITSVVSLAFASASSFPDVPASCPYYVAISDLASRGIIGGYTNGNFGPNDPVTRQQFAKMIVLSGGYSVSEGDVCPFADVENGGPDSFFPDNYVAVCAAHGITTGKTATTFDPGGKITRYQVVSMAVRAVDNLAPGLLAAPPTSWAGNTTWAADPTHGANARRVEYGGLLAGLDLASLNPSGNMTRGEVAQVLHNLLLALAQRLPTLQVHYIDVGQGDSILILSPEGKVMLVDGGESGSGALTYLKSKGITHVDLMVATHPHSDHIGGLVDILKAMPVAEVVTNGQPTTTLTYEHFLDAIKAAKALYKEAKRGDTLTLGSLTFSVLHPDVPEGDDLNAQSLVLRLQYGKVAFLFTGDAQESSEESMLAAGLNVQAQILKVGHHGSRTSSSPEFLAAVKPQVAIYSCGLGNSYGHPHAETLANLAAVGAKVYGTDVNGTIVVTSDGNTYQVTATKGQPRAPPSSTTTTTAPTTTSTTSTTVPSSLAINVVSLTSPISRGATATLAIKTTPGAQCTITVNYKSGPSSASGLGPKTAGLDGTVTWSWKVGSSTTPGTWSIVVTASAGGKTVTKTTPFQVTS